MSNICYDSENFLSAFILLLKTFVLLVINSELKRRRVLKSFALLRTSFLLNKHEDRERIALGLKSQGIKCITILFHNIFSIYPINVPLLYFKVPSYSDLNFSVLSLFLSLNGCINLELFYINFKEI